MALFFDIGLAHFWDYVVFSIAGAVLIFMTWFVIASLCYLAFNIGMYFRRRRSGNSNDAAAELVSANSVLQAELAGANETIKALTERVAELEEKLKSTQEKLERAAEIKQMIDSWIYPGST